MFIAYFRRYMCPTYTTQHFNIYTYINTKSQTKLSCMLNTHTNKLKLHGNWLKLRNMAILIKHTHTYIYTRWSKHCHQQACIFKKGVWLNQHICQASSLVSFHFVFMYIMLGQESICISIFHVFLYVKYVTVNVCLSIRASVYMNIIYLFTIECTLFSCQCKPQQCIPFMLLCNDKCRIGFIKTYRRWTYHFICLADYLT